MVLDGLVMMMMMMMMMMTIMLMMMQEYSMSCLGNLHGMQVVIPSLPLFVKGDAPTDAWQTPELPGLKS